MSHRETATTAERSLYLAVRSFIGLAGLLWILITLSSHLLTPALLYDEAPGPPPLRDRTPAIVLSIALGVFLCVPHRWTVRAYLFWPRVAIYSLLAAFSLVRAAQGFAGGLVGEKSWHVYPASGFMACLGLMLPLCFLWSRRVRSVT